MKLSSPILVVPLATLATSRILPRQKAIDHNAAPPDLSTLDSHSLFYTWRPKAHVLPAFGQMGDPCMMYTDPDTGLFHVGYLHQGASGATTKDLVTYEDLNPNSAPFLQGGGINDPLTVFDGSVIEKGVNGKPTLLYTSVKYLPIHWTIPYPKGAETQSLAYVRDGGRDVEKPRIGPVIPDAPFATNVTAFRDPYVFQNHEIDTLLGKKKDTWYTVVSGGIHGVGPTMFLYGQYEKDQNEFQTWEYLGEWWGEPANSTWNEEGWAGRWGYNFEVANIFSVDEHGANAEGETFMTLGAEWSHAPIVAQVTEERDMLWAAGKQSVVNGKVKFEPTMAGRMDGGRSSYAAAGKLLPADSQASRASGAPDRAISYLWLTGDLYGRPDFPITAQQNWTGTLLLPRELTRCHLDVIDNELSRGNGSWRIEQDQQSGSSQGKTIRLTTMCQKIAREVISAFKTKATNIITLPGGRQASGTKRKLPQTPKSNNYMLTTSITFPSRSQNLKSGFSILSGAHESTRVLYDISREHLVVERTNSSAAANTTFGLYPYDESSLFRLFDVPSPSGNGTQIETLNLTIVVDGGVVEVHVNDRFALSTWVRPWYADSRDIAFFVEGGDVQLGNVTVYEGLVDAWPSRKNKAAAA